MEVAQAADIIAAGADTMHAMLCEHDTLRWSAVPDPVPADGEVLIAVMAAGINYNNVWAARGYPVDQVGTLLSNGVGNGANEIYSVSYYSSGYDDAYAEALKKAVDLARTKAEALAEASGRTLGYVVSIEEYSDSQYGRYVDGGVNLKKESAVMAAAGAEDTAADMNVMPGEMEVSANIKIVFSMGD
jgi:hypothetical protein